MDSPFWTAVGFLGAAIFGCRFLLQWLKTEREKKLVVPWYFWHLSFWGSVLNCIYFFHLDKAPLILGNCFLPFVYARNIIFVTRSGEKAHQGGRKVFALVAILLIVSAGAAMIVGSVKQHEAMEEMDAVIESVKAYKKATGRLPESGAGKLLSSILSGSDQQNASLKERLKKAHAVVSDQGELLDPWGTPYRIYVTDDGILVRSAGKNGIFDEGIPNDHEDDLIIESRF